MEGETMPVTANMSMTESAALRLQTLREKEGNPKLMSLGLHLRIIGRPGRIWALEEFFRHIRKHSDVWVTTRLAIAKHFAKVSPA